MSFREDNGLCRRLRAGDTSFYRGQSHRCAAIEESHQQPKSLPIPEKIFFDEVLEPSWERFRRELSPGEVRA